MAIFEIITSIFLSKVLVAMIDMVALFLVYVVYRDNPKKTLNRFYVWMTFLMLSWINFAYLPRILGTEYYAIGIFSLKFAWFVTPLFFISIYLVSVYLAQKQIKMRWITFLVVFTGIICSLTAAFSDTIISGYQVINGVTTITYGSLMWIFLAGVSFSIIMTLMPIFTSKGILKDRKIFLFYCGVFIFLFLNSIFNIILPIFLKDARFYFLGDYSTLVLLAFIVFAIVRHQLFNIKVVVAEILTFFIWAAVFIQIIAADTTKDRIFPIFLFMYVLIFGIFLIRSVKAEIRQREQTEKMEKQMEKAYQVEKDAKEQLEKLAKVKNQFIMTIQHHLRTPLTSMRGYADLLLTGAYGKVPKKIEEVIRRFESSTTGLLKMVNDFLDITQFQMGKNVISLKDGVNLSSMLDGIVQDIKFEADKKGIELKLEKPESDCLINADESKLKAAIVNIFDNSVKYTEKGSVAMSLKILQDKFIIQIKDTGMGIDKERLNKLFDNILERSDESKKAFVSGRGIGLYLSKQIISAHNGKVWAESEGQGKGATFYIELPTK